MSSYRHKPTASSGTPVQRIETPHSASETSKVLVSRTLQRKVTLGAANDPLEVQADQVANRVSAGQKAGHITPINASVPQAKVAGSEVTGQAATDLENAAQSSGVALSPPVQAKLDEGFSRDMSHIRVHHGSESAAAATAINAQAYTTGGDIHFAQGKFNPATPSGFELLAHEATHTVQQGAADRLQRKEGHVQRDGEDAALKLKASQIFAVYQAAWTDAQTNANAWISAASQFGLCYKKAWDNHDKVRKNQEKVDKLKVDIAFMILGVVTGGVLSGLGASLKKGGEEALGVFGHAGLVDATKRAAIGIEGLSKPDAKLPSVNVDPLSYYLDLKSAVDKLIATTTGLLNGHVQWAKDLTLGKKPLSEIQQADPVKLDAGIQDWKKTCKLFTAPPTVDEAALTKELEIGLWSQWVQGLKVITHIPAHYNRCGYQIPARDSVSFHSPGGVIEKHLAALIPSVASIDFGWWTSMEEIQKLISWGQSWSPSTKFDI